MREVREAGEGVCGEAAIVEDDPGLQKQFKWAYDDFEVAIEEGSTIVRVGSAIFGSR